MGRQGVRRTHSLSGLDVAVLRFVTRFGMVRSHHIAVWTGASPWTIQERLPILVKAGLLRSHPLSIDLRDDTGRVVETLCYVWEVTSTGAEAAGEWAVPGTNGEVLGMEAARPSKLISHHTLGAVDLACWYRLHGFEVASEREIVSLERDSALTPGRSLSSHWSVTPRAHIGIHPPDLGAVDATGKRWAVELERAVKTTSEYAAVVAAYRNAHLGQVWHILRIPTMRRMKEACEQVGIQWADTDDSLWMSTDGQVRIVAWLPGRARVTSPKEWRRQVPRRRAPAGFLVPEPPPDLTLEWRQRVRRDINAVTYRPDAIGRSF